MLNSSQISQAQFSKSKNGYDQVEVDNLLDAIEKDYNEFEGQLSALNAKIKSLEAENESIKISQSSIQSVLVSAQKLADEIVEKARVDAEGIINEAVEKAKAVEHESETRKIAAEQAIKQLLADAAKKSEGMITAAHDSVARQQILFDDLKQQISDFKNDIKAKYKEHIELLAQIPDCVPGTATEAAAAVKDMIEQKENESAAEPIAEENQIEQIEEDAPVDTAEEVVEEKSSGFTVNFPYDDDDLEEQEQTIESSIEQDTYDNPEEEIDFGKSKFFRRNK